MTEYLEPAELDEVRDAALATFADPQWRAVLFQGVLKEWVATLPVLPIPAAQIMSDLAAMNRVERLVDGRVPLESWLHNAARTTAEAGPREVFERARDRVARAAAGEPDLGSAGSVDEVQEEIIFRDDTVPFGFLAEGAAAGRAVARVLVRPYQDGVERKNPAGLSEPHAGTGWLLTPALLVTNHHVVNARAAIQGPAPQAADADLALQAAHAVVRFDYDNEQQAGVEVTGAELTAWSAVLDYAVLRLADDPGRQPLPVQPEPLQATLADNVAVNVIQHPDGKAKRVGLRNNIVHDTSERDVRYFTDTERGSSGSPVLTDAWSVCALHRGARRVDVKFQGKQSAYVNVGTQIAAVLADLKTRYPEVYDEVHGSA